MYNKRVLVNNCGNCLEVNWTDSLRALEVRSHKTQFLFLENLSILDSWQILMNKQIAWPLLSATSCIFFVTHILKGKKLHLAFFIF